MKPSPHRIAVVDIGTNSVKLLIAHAHKTRRFEIDHFLRQTSRIRAEDRAQPACIDTNVAVLATLDKTIRSFDCRHTFVFGTQGLRELKRTDTTGTVIATLERAVGAPIRILGGKEEARYAYLSAKENLALKRRRTVLIDVGGGSTELVVADRGRVRHARSLPIGALGLTERFIQADPVDDDEFKALTDHVDRTWRRVAAATDLAGQPADSIDLVASGGTIGTLSLVMAGRTTFPKPRFARITPLPNVSSRQVKEFLDRCLAMPLRDRKRIKGLEPDRADIICAGLAIVLSVMKNVNKRVLQPNHGGVREGVLIHVLQNELRW
ncbi:MAG: hypothetical protein JSW50_03250 [Candidatus Latescibacterota bacterium]|nr:MAG: hypothetical protein JSW50_03250 [Candidatus Latescibacterota bacterium]